MPKVTKINKLLQVWPRETVALSSWLREQDVSNSLQERYLKSGWIESIGVGAVIRSGDKIDWMGGLYAIQNHSNLSVHVGGLTAMILQGSGHYIRFKEVVQLFGCNTRAPLPSWFRNYKWGSEVRLYRTNFLPHDLGFKEYENNSFNITISSPERAMLECLYLTPLHIDLVECYHIMEGLLGLRPELVQELLTRCTSVKVKRLFLYMAEKANHAWLDFVNLKYVDLGKGKRSMVAQGFYDKKYQITLPRELEDL